MTKEMLSVRIPKEMNKQLSDYLKPLGITKNSFILNLIKIELEKCNYSAFPEPKKA